MTSQADTRGIGRTRDRDLVATAWDVKQKEKKEEEKGKKQKEWKERKGREKTRREMEGGLTKRSNLYSGLAYESALFHAFQLTSSRAINAKNGLRIRRFWSHIAFPLSPTSRQSERKRLEIQRDPSGGLLWSGRTRLPDDGFVSRSAMFWQIHREVN